MRKLVPTLAILGATSLASGIALAATAGVGQIVDVAGTGGACRAFNGPMTAPPEQVRYDTDPSDVEVGTRVIVSPTRIEPDDALRPGESMTCTVTIRNRRATRTRFELIPTGIVGSRSAGAPFRFVDAADPDAASTAASWLTPAPSEVTLDPRGVAKVPVVVRVPSRATGGGAYASIDVRPRPASDRVGASDGASVGIESRASIPMLLEVSGGGSATLAFERVRAPSVRWDRDPWTWRAELVNDGTVHADASGRVRVRSIFGSTVAELPFSARTLLPDAGTDLELTWRGLPWFGIFSYDARAGDARADGWILVLPPWWAILLGLLLVAAIIGGAVARRRRERAWAVHLAEHGDDEFDDADD